MIIDTEKNLIEALNNMSAEELSRIYWPVRSAYTDRMKTIARNEKKREKENQKKNNTQE